MRTSSEASLRTYSEPPLLTRAVELVSHLRKLSGEELSGGMKISPALAEKTQTLFGEWQERRSTLPAIDAFLGDMYSGLQARTFTTEDRQYAHECFYILSGLYGVARALDNVHPYRLEMGYRLPAAPIQNLYEYWGGAIAAQLPKNRIILNLSVPEYTKAVLPYMDGAQVITPVFLTVKDGKPQPVVIHSKIARGAFAHWVIVNRIESPEKLQAFDNLGYHYNATLSTPSQPVYVTRKFQGLGMSVRLTKDT
ncbi:YaaA family protein [Candidatus Saccharibacteria bacterium TM7i]|nr:YaaA family protein [Candidatus Saccharibacteria bacterium TM7i]